MNIYPRASGGPNREQTAECLQTPNIKGAENLLPKKRVIAKVKNTSPDGVNRKAKVEIKEFESCSSHRGEPAAISKCYIAGNVLPVCGQ